MHQRDRETEALTDAVVRYALDRLQMDPPPLDGPRAEDELRARAGPTITPDGLGGDEALAVFADVLAPACISTDHPRFLSFVPVGAHRGRRPVRPRRRGVVDLRRVVAGGRRRGVRRERGAALARRPGRLPRRRRRRASCRVGRPATSSALVAARHAWRTGAARGRARPAAVAPSLASAEAHSSIAADGPGDGRRRDRRRRSTTRGRLTAARPAAGRLDELGADAEPTVFAVVATGGTTNAGIVDDLAGVADVAAELGLWLPRRRRLRRRRAGRAERPAAVRRHRAGRQLRGRPPQVAVRAVRLRRPRLPRARAWPGPPTPSTPSTSTCCTRAGAGVEPDRLRLPPHPPGPGPAVLVLAGHPRHRRLPPPRSRRRWR